MWYEFAFFFCHFIPCFFKKYFPCIPFCLSVSFLLFLFEICKELIGNRFNNCTPRLQEPGISYKKSPGFRSRGFFFIRELYEIKKSSFSYPFSSLGSIFLHKISIERLWKMDSYDRNTSNSQPPRA